MTWDRGPGIVVAPGFSQMELRQRAGIRAFSKAVVLMDLKPLLGGMRGKGQTYFKPGRALPGARLPWEV